MSNVNDDNQLEIKDNMIEKKFVENIVGETVTIFLINGVKLTGEILEADDSCLVTSVNSSSSRARQLVYRHAIASIQNITK